MRPAQAAPPPPPWTVGNIGLSNGVGSAVVDSRGVWSIRAATIDAPYVLDSLFTVAQPLEGDGSILAMLLAQAGGHAEWGQAGVSFLEQTNLRARAVHLHMSTGHGVAFSYRAASGSRPLTEAGDDRYGPRRFPIWIRLQREGDRFTPFSSADGDAWTQLRTPLPLPGFPLKAQAAITAASGKGEAVSALLASPLVARGLTSPRVDAFAGNGSVLLSWQPVRDAVGYVVRRGAPGQSVYAAANLTPEPIRETSFMESGVPNGRPVRYLVTALFPEGESTTEGWMTEASVQPDLLPHELICGDLNLVATQVKGACSFDSFTENWQIRGAGSAPGGTEDRCFISARRLSGDAAITVRVLERPSRVSSLSSAGLMLRESLTPDARMVFLAVTAGRGLSLYARSATAGTALPVGTPLLADRDLHLPLYLRLVRRSAQVTVYLSQEGQVFRPAGTPVTFNPPLAGALYGGYAITSDNAGVPATGRFRELSFTPPP